MKWLVPLLLLGCGPEEEVACSTLAAASVSLSLVDDTGAAVAGSTLTYTVDGFPKVYDCEDHANGDYTCGYEVQGTLDITIEAAGFLTDVIQVTVGADECHVITESVTHTLTPGTGTTR